MPSIRFLKTADDALDFLHLSRRSVIECIENPTEVELIINRLGQHMRIFLKVPETHETYLPYLVFAIQSDPAWPIEVLDALKVPAGMYPRADGKNNPLSILKSITERFGCMIEAGGSASTLIVSEQIRTPENPARMFRIIPRAGISTGREKMKLHWMNREYENYGEKYDDCMLIFAIDETQYLLTIS